MTTEITALISTRMNTRMTTELTTIITTELTTSMTTEIAALITTEVTHRNDYSANCNHNYTNEHPYMQN